ncbi:MAG: hypothetical protein JXB23_15335 [Candidatus Aminicenantes bacterium]|nr:hypothetical protein [Candidatus Aminicenantes bacterium]
MTGLQKRALFDLIISAVVLPCLTIIFFSGGGAATYVQDTTRKLLLAVLLGLGYLALFLVLFLVRVKPKGQTMFMDERDERIARQALGTAFIVLAIYVVLTCIVLYEFYYSSRVMPVGWMWFLAYSSSFVAISSRASVTLIFYARMNRHGQG